MEGRAQRDEERKRDKVEGDIKTWLERKEREKKKKKDSEKKDDTQKQD